MVIDFTSYFSTLKKTIEGNDDFYFLVNDSNHEIRQHYDMNYEVNFDYEKFIYSFLSKKSYLNSMNINYNFFVIPDKSVILKDYLPFDAPVARRVTDNLTDYIYDLLTILEDSDVLKNDSHITPLSSLKIVPYIISVMDNVSSDIIREKLSSKLKEVIKDHKGDLFFDINWSYPKDERFKKNAHLDVTFLELKDDVEQVDLKDIPDDFRKVSRRQSLYYKNPHSISDKRALILRDSSTNFLIPIFTAYYREVFFYWDQWYFNKNLVEWYNPDDVIEIRTERFLNNALYPTLDDDFIIQHKLIVEDEIFDNIDDKIKWQFLLLNYYNQKVNADAEVFLDDKLLGKYHIKDGLFRFEDDFSIYTRGNHTLKIFIAQTKLIQERVIIKDFLLNPRIDLSGLKSTLKGKDNMYFLGNDSNHELLQHYFYDYKSNFNLYDFKKYIDSKNEYFKKENIIFKQFIIPDKSVILKNYLPFETGEILRHIDKLKNYYYDLSNVLVEDDYLSNDTKITDNAALKSTLFIISRLFTNLNGNEIKDDLCKRLIFKSELYPGDLFHKSSWSYGFDEEYEKNKNVLTEVLYYKNENSIHKQQIPDKFRQFNKIESLYYKNDDYIQDKRVLIIADKSIHPFIKLLVVYFREVFFYHDCWYFNHDLIGWFKPDIVLEIRAERTLDNAIIKRISYDSVTLIPITVNLMESQVKDNNLHIKAYCDDLRKLPLDAEFKIFIDEKLVCEDNLDNGFIIFEYDLTDYDKGCHNIKIRIEEGIDTKAKLINKTFNIE